MFFCLKVFFEDEFPIAKYGIFEQKSAFVLKEIIKKYKPVIRFIVLFLGSYLILSFLYSLYLKFSANGSYYPDFFTHLVARQSAAVLDAFGYAPVLTEIPQAGGMFITIDDNYSVNVVEGCNSISVIILFIAFVISFAESFKKTFLFLLAGMVLIYVINIFRISFLAVAMYKFPEYQHLLHGVLFPAIIYGMVFLLWMVWIRSIKPKSKS